MGPLSFFLFHGGVGDLLMGPLSFFLFHGCDLHLMERQIGNAGKNW
jgi:hypothetical protein